MLGITSVNKEVLAEALRSTAENSNDAELLGNNGHGDVYVLRFQLKTERGAASVLSAWIIRDYEDFPHLITCYML